MNEKLGKALGILLAIVMFPVLLAGAWLMFGMQEAVFPLFSRFGADTSEEAAEPPQMTMPDLQPEFSEAEEVFWRLGFDTCWDIAQDPDFYEPAAQLGTTVAVPVLVENFRGAALPSWTEADTIAASEGCRDAYSEAWARFPA